MRRRFGAPTAVIGLVVAAAAVGSAVAAKTRTIHFTETSLGAQILSRGSYSESAFKITSSVDGNGAGVSVRRINGTAFPVRGSDTTTTYFANGVSTGKDTWTVGVPNAKGISVITGSGKCTGGTGYHKRVKCSYTLKGTYDTKTTITAVKLTGTKTF
jgi:hypothetical protein